MSGSIINRIRDIVDVTRSYAKIHSDCRHVGVVPSLARRFSSSQSSTIAGYWWTGKPNFGDALAPAVLAWVTRADPVLVNRRSRGKVLSIGSIHHNIRDGDIVWGTGAQYDQVVEVSRSTVILAVRGPLTAERLSRCDTQVYGDPAILLPWIVDAEIDQFDVGVVPHHSEIDQVASMFSDEVRMIDPRNNWRKVVADISACRHVLASSLHGLIVAEAFGIPATWAVPSAPTKRTRLKFADYYLGTSRDVPEPTSLRASLGTLCDQAAPLPILNRRELVDAWAKHFGGSPQTIGSGSLE